LIVLVEAVVFDVTLLAAVAAGVTVTVIVIAVDDFYS
jgi:hypothetical protein